MTMLALRPNCECCDTDLPPESTEARICSFECTFCTRCVQGRLRGVCPNCGGEFVRRPRRAAAKLLTRPASTQRVYKPLGCAGVATTNEPQVEGPYEPEDEPDPVANEAATEATT